MFHLLKYTY